MTDTIAIRFDGKVIAHLVPAEKPTKQTRLSRRKRLGGDDDDNFLWDLKTGEKLHSEGPRKLAHATFYTGSGRAFLATKDRTTKSFKLKHLRGLTWEDLLDLRCAIDSVIHQREDKASG